MNISRNNLRQSGFGMVEVLVTLIILLVGLLGLAGLMVQGQRSEMESYQRVQALILLQDMVGRINANRNVAQCYAITTASSGAPFAGKNGTTPAACTLGTPAQNTRVASDFTEWTNALLGAAESTGGANTGAMIDARGCISYDAATALPEFSPVNLQPTGNIIAGSGIYTLSIAWQGMGNTFANTNLLCGTTLYGNEAQRRVVSLSFRIAALSK